jgi:putative transcriptional regulator
MVMRQAQSAILEAVHDTGRGLHGAGVMDQITLREFDSMCLAPVAPLEPQKIKHIREAALVARHLPDWQTQHTLLERALFGDAV